MKCATPSRRSAPGANVACRPGNKRRVLCAPGSPEHSGQRSRVNTRSSCVIVAPAIPSSRATVGHWPT